MPFKLDRSRAKQDLAQLSARVPKSILSDLKAMAKKEGLSVTEIIIQMIEQAIAEYKTSRKGG